MHPSLLLCALASFACDSSSQSGPRVSWVWNLQETNADGLRVFVGPDNLVTVAAYNRGLVTFTGPEGELELGQANTPVLILARFRDLGDDGLELVWAKDFRAKDVTGTFNTASPIGLAVTPTGEVALSFADFTDTINLPGTALGVLNPVVGPTTAGVVAMFSDEGVYLWSKLLDIDQHAALPRDVIIDPVGQTVVVLGTARQARDSGHTPLATAGDEQLWVGTLELSDGSTRWARTFGSAGSPVRGARIARDTFGRLLVSGNFTGTLSLGGLHQATAGGHFVAKLDGATGDPVWGVSLQARSGDIGVAVDGDGNAVVVGDIVVDTSPNAPVVPAATVASVIELSSDHGSTVWTHSIRDQDGTGKVLATHVAIDDEDAVVVGGSFRGTVDFAGDPLLAKNADALLVLKFDSDGTERWGRYSGGTGNVFAADVRIGQDNHVYASGVFEEGDTTPPLREVFILKLAP